MLSVIVVVKSWDLVCPFEPCTGLPIEDRRSISFCLQQDTLISFSCVMYFLPSFFSRTFPYFPSLLYPFTSADSSSALYTFFPFWRWGGTYPVVLSAYSWFCAERSLLVVLGRLYGILRLEPWSATNKANCNELSSHFFLDAFSFSFYTLHDHLLPCLYPLLCLCLKLSLHTFLAHSTTWEMNSGCEAGPQREKDVQEGRHSQGSITL